MNSIIHRYYSVTGPHCRYGSHGKASHRSCFVLANWAHQGRIKPSDSVDNQSPGQVQYYFLHSFKMPADTQPRQHLFAYTRWYQPHPNKDTVGNLCRYGISDSFKLVVLQCFCRYNEFRTDLYFIHRTHRKIRLHALLYKKFSFDFSLFHCITSIPVISK